MKSLREFILKFNEEHHTCLRGVFLVVFLVYYSSLKLPALFHFGSCIAVERTTNCLVRVDLKSGEIDRANQVDVRRGDRCAKPGRYRSWTCRGCALDACCLR